MKNKCKYLAMLTLVSVLLFYRVDFIVATAEEQNMGPVAGTESEHTGEIDIESMPEEAEESAAEPEPEETEEPEDEPEPEETEEPEGEPEPEETEEPEGEPEPEETEEPEDEPEPEEVEEPAAGLQSEEAEAFTAEAESEQIVAFSAGSEFETVSTGEALMDWLESHKNTGGTVRLTDHVVLDGAYSFCPIGINGADLFVDTGQYTITVTGEIAFLSNGRLTFSGEPGGQGVFYVAEKGMLSLYGISVKSDHCALWQEEGAGLEVSDCSVLGDIHYADTPFVMYYNDSLCAVVEKGQTLNDALPTQISCTINKQGQLVANEPVALSWNLEGTESRQEERRRFDLQGSFLQAESAEPVRCTVVYNDYPLTFTDVSASASGSGYTFQGGFTAPKESLPFTVMAEYSFDGENWIVCEEQKATNTNSGFCIYIPVKLKQRSAAVGSKIYIRLQWNDNGTRYFSNVLCYAADNVEQVDDIGGSRGGGTSIINPPDAPLQTDQDSDSVNGEALRDGNDDAASDNDKPKTSAEDSPSENGSEKDGQTAVNENSTNAEIPDAYTGQTDGIEIQAIQETAQMVNTESQATQETAQMVNTESRAIQEEAQAANSAQATQEAVQASDMEPQATQEAVQASDMEPQATQEAVQTAQIEESLYAGSKLQNKANLKSDDAKAPEKNGGTVRILMAAGFVLLSGIAGTAGFCVHFRSGTNR